MKLKLIFVCLAIALVQITPLNAQAVSPPGHYSKKSGGAGEMRVEKSEGDWRIFVIAGGVGCQVLRGLTDVTQRLLRAVPSNQLKRLRTVPPAYLAEEFRDLSSHAVGFPIRNARHAAFKADLRRVRTIHG